LQDRRFLARAHRSRSRNATYHSQFTQDRTRPGVGQQQVTWLAFDEDLHFTGENEQNECRAISFLEEHFICAVLLDLATVEQHSSAIQSEPME
jgi:hypothetical protein